MATNVIAVVVLFSPRLQRNNEFVLYIVTTHNKDGSKQKEKSKYAIDVTLIATW